jgi:large subunit ribosomal protein L3
MRSILKPPPKPSRFDQAAPPKALSKASALKRKEYTTPHRTGVLAKKKGMSVVWDAEKGVRIPCTVLQLDRNQVVSHKTRERHGYYAVQMGFGYRHPDNCTRQELGHYAGAKVSPKQALMEFKVRGIEGLIPVGTVVGPTWFRVGQFVDTRSKNRGMGFAGVSFVGHCGHEEPSQGTASVSDFSYRV